MTEETVNTLPYNRDAEDAVIGSVLIDGDLYEKAGLVPTDFFIRRNGMIWEAMGDLARARQAIDFVTLLDALKGKTDRSGRTALEEIGGPAYVMGLINRCASSLNFDAYAAIVRRDRKKRDMIRGLQEALVHAMQPETEVGEIATHAMNTLMQSVQTKAGLHHWAEDISRVYDLVKERMAHPSDIWGLPTGLKPFDMETGGLQKKEVVMLTGAPGAGKSLLARQMLRQVANGDGYPKGQRRKHNVAAYSLEMSTTQVTLRDLSAMSKVPTRLMKNGMIGAADHEKFLDDFVQAVDEAAAMPIYQSDRTDWTPAEMRADIARLKAKLEEKGETLDLVLIDYFLLLLPSIEGPTKEHEKATLLSHMMKMWAMELDLSLLVINSVIKDGQAEGAGASMTNTHGGAQVNHNADLLIHLMPYRPPADEESGEEAKVPKSLWPNLRTVQFVKGRDMENPTARFDLVKGKDSPWFAIAATEPEYLSAMNAFIRRNDDAPRDVGRAEALDQATGWLEKKKDHSDRKVYGR